MADLDCVDYRLLNAQTKKKRCTPLPREDEYVDALEGARLFHSWTWLATIIRWQWIRRQRKIAFTTLCRLYKCQRMSMGLSNATSTFQRLMQSSMHDILFQLMLVYLDDILVFSVNVAEHLEKLERVFQRPQELKLKLNGNKFQFCKKRIHFRT